jgi:ribonucleoside-diphosphate reductase alpha chain
MEMTFSDNALRVLGARYLRHDSSGEVVERPEELFRRVARTVAQAEDRLGDGAAGEWEEEFIEAMTCLELLPNSPCLMNAGTPLGMLSACFVLPVEDSMEGIFDSLKLMALIQQAGGGVGFSFARLRPRGDRVASTGGTAGQHPAVGNSPGGRCHLSPRLGAWAEGDYGLPLRQQGGAGAPARRGGNARGARALRPLRSTRLQALARLLEQVQKTVFVLLEDPEAVQFLL